MHRVVPTHVRATSGFVLSFTHDGVACSHAGYEQIAALTGFKRKLQRAQLADSGQEMVDLLLVLTH
jgi:hypothetical protein